MTTKKLNLSGFLKTITVILFMATAIISCKESKTEEKKEPETKKEDTKQSETPLAFNGNFPYLTLSLTDLDNYFTPNGVQKIVFRFQFDDGNAAPGLVGYKATSVRVFNPATPLTPKPQKQNISVNLAGELILGNLELTRTQYNDLKTGAGGSTLVIFEPRLNGQNVTYRLATGAEFSQASLNGLTFLAATEMNPSPPARPEGSN